MYRAVIIGTYENLGFRFCTSLLEEGYEVKGIHYNYGEEEYLEEKRMEIGRNANFQEGNYKEWLPFTNITEQALIIIDLHNLHLQNKSRFFEISDYLEKFLIHNEKEINETHSKVIFLLPVESQAPMSEIFSRIPQKVAASHYKYLYFSEGIEIESEYIKELIDMDCKEE